MAHIAVCVYIFCKAIWASHSTSVSCVGGVDGSVFLQIRSPTLLTHMDTLMPGDIDDKLFKLERNSLPPFSCVDMCKPSIFANSFCVIYIYSQCIL